MSVSENKLILLRGLPGSGKSTFAEFLAQFLFHSCDSANVKEFSTDSYFVNADGEYVFKAENLRRNHYKCQTAVRDFFIGNSATPHRIHNVAIVHNTSTTEFEVDVYKKIADDFGAQFISLIVENRHGNKNVHAVPKEAIERITKRFTFTL